MSKENYKDWDLVIKPQNKFLDLKITEVLRYRDLLFLLVRRDIVTIYKQTILGPLWIIIQPILTTLIFTFVFGKVANISTDGLPQILFYLSGVIAWSYFAECFKGTSATFIKNAGLFGKVYFPRVILPVSIVLSNLVKFGVQLLLFFGFWLWFFANGTPLYISPFIALFPVLLVIMAGLGIGFGMIITSLTTKYRDLNFLIQFGVQLLMYTTPVVYPLSIMPEKYRLFILANPMTSVLETFRFIFLGTGGFAWSYLAYSLCFTVILVFVGLLIFNRTEKNFIDTV